MSRASNKPRSALSPGARRRREGGFTLLEVMLAAMMLTVGAIIAFPTLVSLIRLSRLSNEVNIAMFDLEEAIEDMHSVPFEDLEEEYWPGEGAVTPGDPVRVVELAEFVDRHLQDQRVQLTFTRVNEHLLNIEAACTWRSISNGEVTRSIETSRGSS